jgi:hypothetical protein
MFLTTSRSVFLRVKNVANKFVQEIKTHTFVLSYFPKKAHFMKECEKIGHSQTGQRWQ